MHLAIVTGVFLFASFAAITYLGAVAQEGTAFYALMYALFFIFQSANPAIVGAEPPAAFVSAEGLSLALDGARSAEFFGLGVIITLAATLIALTTAYTRAMVITVASDATQRKHTSIIDLFRGARARFIPSFIAFLPIAIIAGIIITTSIPALIMNINYAVLGESVPANVWSVTRLFALVVLASYLAKTVFADGVIAEGSRRPIRESVAYLLVKWRRGLATIAFLLAVFGGVLVLDRLRGAFTMPDTLALVVTLLFFALVAVWRLWTTFFVVRLVR